jgi:hypothetical protein
LNHFTMPVAITIPISVNLGCCPLDRFNQDRKNRLILRC